MIDVGSMTAIAAIRAVGFFGRMTEKVEIRTIICSIADVSATSANRKRVSLDSANSPHLDCERKRSLSGSVLPAMLTRTWIPTATLMAA